MPGFDTMPNRKLECLTQDGSLDYIPSSIVCSMKLLITASYRGSLCSSVFDVISWFSCSGNRNACLGETGRDSPDIVLYWCAWFPQGSNILLGFIDVSISLWNGNWNLKTFYVLNVTVQYQKLCQRQYYFYMFKYCHLWAISLVTDLLIL